VFKKLNFTRNSAAPLLRVDVFSETSKEATQARTVFGICCRVFRSNAVNGLQIAFHLEIQNHVAAALIVEIWA
jgi:hypothetical protein